MWLSVTVLPLEVTATTVIVVAPLLHGRFVRLMFFDAALPFSTLKVFPSSFRVTFFRRDLRERFRWILMSRRLSADLVVLAARTPLLAAGTTWIVTGAVLLVLVLVIDVVVVVFSMMKLFSLQSKLPLPLPFPSPALPLPLPLPAMQLLPYCVLEALPWLPPPPPPAMTPPVPAASRPIVRPAVARRRAPALWRRVPALARDIAES